MKKRMKCIVLLMVAVFAVLSGGCFGSSNGSGSIAEEPKTQTITVYKEDTPTTYTVTFGEVAEIDVFTKSGYYFVGAYDAKQGGTKYFDESGYSTMVWSAGNPDTYYARFDSIENIAYTGMEYEEEPFGWSGSTTQYVPFEFTPEFKNAVAANLDSTLNISVSVSLSCDKDWGFGKVGVTNLKSGGENVLLAKGTSLQGGQYTTLLKLDTTMSARLVKDGTIFVYLQALSANVTTTKYYFKNVSVTISFANAE